MIELRCQNQKIKTEIQLYNYVSLLHVCSKLKHGDVAVVGVLLLHWFLNTKKM